MSAKRVSTVRLIWLEAFVHAAESGTYKDAGERLGLDPTVVKKYISALENWLDSKLVETGSKKVILKPNGRTFLNSSKIVIQLLYKSKKSSISSLLTSNYDAEPDPPPDSGLDDDVVDANFGEVKPAHALNVRYGNDVSILDLRGAL